MTTPAARVLIVDDNTALAENISEILTEEGCECRAVGSAKAALAASADGYDVALVDLRLPDGDGTELAGQLKQKVPLGEIVVLTGYATVATATAAVRAGAFAYLIKPCAMPELLLTIQQAMRHVRLAQEKRDLARRAMVAEKLAAVGTLTAGLSHEIKNPLNSAGLWLTILERRVRTLDEKLQPPLLLPLATVQNEIRRLDHLLVDFLQFARPQVLTPKPVDFGAVIGAVLELLTGEAVRRGVHLSRATPTLPSVAGDGDRLKQVVMNLTLNALDATPNGGTVTLTASHVGEEVVLTVDDTGAGISREARERIFEPFFTTKASGTGLGLPIVHAIVTQHGGQISSGTAPSGGARMTVRLPIMR